MQVGALLLITAGVVYEVRNNRKHKNLFGKVLPPGLGAETSILVASVQVSTHCCHSKQYRTVQYGAVQYGAVQYGTVQYVVVLACMVVSC